MIRFVSLEEISIISIISQLNYLKRPSLKVLESADSDVCATQARLGLASDTFRQFGGFNVSM